MEANVSSVESSDLNRTRVVSASLDISAIVLALSAVVWGLIRLWGIWGSGSAVEHLDQTVTVVVAMVLGLIGGVALWALGELLRQLDQLADVVARRPAPGMSVVAGTSPRRADGGAASGSLVEVASILREIRDVSLLDDDQRAERVRIQGQELLRQLTQELPHLLREHRWIEAHERLRHARISYPGIPDWQRLEEQVEAARERIEEQDVANAKRQIMDLVALGAWERASDAARELAQRHPKSEAAAQLAHDILAKRDDALTEQRAKLLQDAQAATDQRDWRGALQIANQMIERFPKAVEAEALRQQLPTLRSNAEIQTRQEMEGQIREYIQQHRFAEAASVARHLIAQYPNSPQAVVLKDQLPRLESRAAEQHALP